MICPNCGQTNGDSTKFCTACGYRLDLQSSADTGNQSQYNQNTQTPPPVYTQQPTQQTPSYAPNFEEERRKPLSTGQFVLMDFLMFIPIANIVLLFVWAFSSSENENRRNWAKAKLIWVLIWTGIILILVILFASLGLTLFRSLDYLLY